MSTAIKQHFVPQFYLRNFGTGGSIALYNIERRQHFTGAPIKGQCQRRRMYDNSLGLDVENTLAKLEGAAAAVINRVIETGLPPERRHADFLTLLLFITSLRSRTPAAGREISTIATQLTRAYFKSSPRVPERVKESINELKVEPKEPIGFSLGLATRNTPYLMDLEVVVIKNEGETEFITSDAPVIFFNQWCQDVTERGTIGLTQSGLQVFLPLSPRSLLLLYDRSVYKIGGRNKNSVTVKNDEDVDAINSLQLITAEEKLYYSGAVETKSGIERLPFEKRRTRAEAVVTRRGIEASGESILIHSFGRPPSIKLGVSFITLMRRKRRIPINERVLYRRKGAEEVYTALEGPRRSRYNPPPGPRKWRIIDE